MIGTIGTLKAGFGFIRQQNPTKAQVFFHHTVLEGLEFNQLRTGDRVEAVIQNTDKGLRATSVKKLELSTGTKT